MLPSTLAVKRSTGIYGPEDVMVITCTTLSIYNAIELCSLIFTTFKRRSGLYFWSLLLASVGVGLYAVGWLVDYFNLTLDFVGMIIASVGWALMVTGQAFVLYSRLHLILMNGYILRALKWMIIFNGVVWHTSMTVLLFTISYRPDQQRTTYNGIFNIMEKIQMTFFCLQEFIISGLYVWKTGDILKTSFNRTHGQRLMWQLFTINIIIVLMDISLLAVEFTDHYLWQQGLKVTIYSIKLKLEFAVLGRLVDFVQHGHEQRNSAPRSSRGADVIASRGHSRKSVPRANSKVETEVIHLENMNMGSTCISVERSSHFETIKPGKISVTRDVKVQRHDREEVDRRSNKSTDELFLRAT